MAHDKVKEAAVIALPSTKWGERPCACVVLEPVCVGDVMGRETGGLVCVCVFVCEPHRLFRSS